MKLRKSLLFVISCISQLLVSCVGTNAVTNGHGIQKRKYTKGFYIEQRSNTASLKHQASDKTKEMAWADLSISESPETITKNPIKLSDIAESKAQSETEEITTEEEKSEATNKLSGSTSVVSQAGYSRKQLTQSRGLSRFKSIRENVKEVKKQLQSRRSESGIMLVLLVILCFILPPLAVGIFEGITTRFWIDLILWIIGWGLGVWLLGGLGWIASIVAVIYALLIVLSVI